ncbi:MAG: hypothetical protein GF421_00650 [Candidatus Aminicenantes bacterium]|nr:hypothetical protein [Candidatus Aminicenantes bacterium]
MRKKFIWLITLVIFWFGAASWLYAHKLEIKITPLPSVVMVEAGYSGHKHGLSGGDVFIYAPRDSEKAFQTGKTDAKGKFAFIPDQAGDWRVAVDDGTGHKSEQILSLGEDFFLQKPTVPGSGESHPPEQARDVEKEKASKESEAAPSQAQVPLVWKALVGVSLVFGIAGILYGAKARKKSG